MVVGLGLCLCGMFCGLPRCVAIRPRTGTVPGCALAVLGCVSTP